jgi:hypothetical protein
MQALKSSPLPSTVPHSWYKLLAISQIVESTNTQIYFITFQFGYRLSDNIFVDNSITFPFPVLSHNQFPDKQGTEPSLSTTSKSENAKTLCHITSLTYSESPKGVSYNKSKNQNQTSTIPPLMRSYNNHSLAKKAETPINDYHKYEFPYFLRWQHKKLRLRLSAA